MRRARKTETIRARVAEILRMTSAKTVPVPVEQIANALGAEVKFSPFKGEKQQIAGMLYQDATRKIIGVNTDHHSNRQRFTIAHEIGHLVLHQKEVFVDRDFSIKRRDKSSSQAVDVDEIEANRFAAELLMPFDLVMSDLGEGSIDIEDSEVIEDLALKYGVSVQAMTFRITNLFGL